MANRQKIVNFEFCFPAKTAYLTIRTVFSFSHNRFFWRFLLRFFFLAPFQKWLGKFKFEKHDQFFMNFIHKFDVSTLDNPCSDIDVTMDPLQSSQKITSFTLFDFSDWRLSKSIIRRLVEAMPMLNYLNFETSTAHHLLEMLELFSHIDSNHLTKSITK